MGRAQGQAVRFATQVFVSFFVFLNPVEAAVLVF